MVGIHNVAQCESAVLSWKEADREKFAGRALHKSVLRSLDYLEGMLVVRGELQCPSKALLEVINVLVGSVSVQLNDIILFRVLVFQSISRFSQLVCQSCFLMPRGSRVLTEGLSMGAFPIQFGTPSVSHQAR